MYVGFGKRLFDISLSVLAIAVIWPILILVPIMIKISDSGPVIFSQIRVGKNGNTFRFYKFRSMPVGTDDISSDKMEGVNLTWVGRLIRRTNVDELPQLFNILIGDMSVVGPRPPIPSQHELIELRRAGKVLEFRPGLTGLAQINSFDGMRPDQKAELDRQYIKKISLWLDLRIIFRTFSYLLRPPPTY